MAQQLLAGRYRIGSLVGTGGMASVYEGEDTSLGRRVAIKILHSHEARTSGAVDRFEHEARSIAALSHPGIVDVYDFGHDGDQYFIVMQFVSGTSVKDMLRPGPLPIQQSVDIGVQVAKALDYAHSRGIVHRDIKPQNLLVMEDGSAKVVDFGIAVSQGDEPAQENGTVLGTVHYVAPEQARGEPPSPASDIYALGVVLYEMLTGRVPFDGTTPVEIATKHVSSEPMPPSRLNPSIPLALERAILHAMEKDPSRRPATAGEFARELASYNDILDQPTSYVPQPMRGALSQNANSQAAIPRRVASTYAPVVVEPAQSSFWPLIVLALTTVALVAGLIPLWTAVLQNYHF